MRRRLRIALGVTLAVLLAAAMTVRTLEERFDARIAAAERRVGQSSAAGAPENLPAIALEYLARAGVASEGDPRVVRIGETGELRRHPDAPWKHFSAVQHLAVRDIGFAWHGTLDVAPGIDVEILDQLHASAGQSDVRLLGAIPLSVPGCWPVDRAETQRYLAGLAWAPHAVRDNAALRLTAVGDRKLEVTAGDGPARTSIELELDEHGDIIRSVAMRPRVENGTVVERRWVAELSRHDRLGAVRVPTYGEARWVLPEGDFVYLRGEVESLELD